MGGFAQGSKVAGALESVGIVAAGWFWRWYPGAKGGVFPPHVDLGGEFASDISEFDSLPQGDVNGDYCECDLQTVWRDERTGRFAKGGGVTAALEPHTHVMDRLPDPALVAMLTDLLAANTSKPPVVHVTVPEAPPAQITVNVEPTPFTLNTPEVYVSPAEVTVNVEPTPISMNTPEVFVSPAEVSVNVEPTPVTVAAPNVTVEPTTVTAPDVHVEYTSPTPAETPIKESKYFSGIKGRVTIPKGFVIVSVTAEAGESPASIVIGGGDTIPIPERTAFFDDFDDAPIVAKAVTFKNTTAYYVRAVPI